MRYRFHKYLKMHLDHNLLLGIFDETFFYGSTVLVDLGLFLVDVSRLHSDTLHLVGLLSASDRPLAQTSR